MRKITLFLFISFICSFTFSQENFKPGYIVTLKGDTVHGLVDYRGWGRNPSQIIFRQQEGTEKIKYSPADISAFSVEGENYISETVQVETSPYLLSELKNDPELHFVTEDAFLYCMVQGKKTLYHYKDARDKDNFYIGTDSGTVLLVHKEYLNEIKRQDISNGAYAGTHMDSKYSFRTENKTYLGQLLVYLDYCPAIPPMLSSVEYSPAGLLKLFQTYQKKCDDKIVTNESRSTIAHFGIVAGMSLNSMKLGENETFRFSKTKYSYSPNVMIGISLDLKLRGNMHKWSVNNELLYAPFKVTGEYENYYNENRYERISSEIGSQYFKLNNMIRFRYPFKNYSVYFNFGLSNSYGNIKYNTIHIMTNNYGDITDESDLAMEETDKYELGFNLGAGMGYKRWSLEARWEQGDGMSSLASLKSTTKRLDFIVSYSFTKK